MSWVFFLNRFYVSALSCQALLSSHLFHFLLPTQPSPLCRWITTLLPLHVVRTITQNTPPQALAQNSADGILFTPKTEIVALRKALFAHIPHRDHRILRYYTFDKENMHLMGLGTVGYKHHHGHETGSDWAAKYDLVKVGGEAKFKHVQVIVVSSELYSGLVMSIAFT